MSSIGNKPVTMQNSTPEPTPVHGYQEPVESPRHLVWLLLNDPARLSEAEHQMLTFIRQEPTVECAYRLAQHFIQMMHEHQAAELDTWINTCTSSGIADLETFAVGLQKELSTIKAAFTLSYSTGPVEGQINRLKRDFAFYVQPREFCYIAPPGFVF